MLYLKKIYIVNGNIQANNDDCEIICIELKTPKAKRLNFIIVYRPPTGNIKNMIDYLEEAVGRLNKERTETVIIGDLNMDHSNKGILRRNSVKSFENANHH